MHIDSKIPFLYTLSITLVTCDDVRLTSTSAAIQKTITLINIGSIGFEIPIIFDALPDIDYCLHSGKV